MGFTFNIAKGRVGEFFFRVDNNDPGPSALVFVVLAETNLESDVSMMVRDDLNSILVTGPSDEVTNSGYARSTLTDATGTGGWSVTGSSGIATPAPDDSNHRFDYDIPDPQYTAVAAGNNWRKVLLCYDADTAAGTDANIIPLLAQDITVNPDGSNITLQIAASGIWRAQ